MKSFPDLPHTPANAQLDAVMVVNSRKLSRKYRTNRVLNPGPVVCESSTLSARPQRLPDINSEVACYYKTLYSRNVLNIDERFFEHRIKLTDEQRELCEGNLTFNECTESLKSMKNGKSPGSDGYTVDFYKIFWKYIGPFLFRSL